MTTFQLVAVPPIAGFVALSARRLLRGDHPRWFFLLRVLVGLAAASAILWPEATNRLARIFGIGRGADLVMYVIGLLGIAAFFYFYQKTRSLESQVTGLVRFLALERRAQAEAQPAPARGDAGRGSPATD
jgi:hypothetical protein